MKEEDFEENEEESQQNQSQQNEETKNMLSNERMTDFNLNEVKDDEISKLTSEHDLYEQEKTCSMKEGSIQGSVFTLSSMALGTGAFSLPIRCTQLGCFWYSILIILGAFAAYWTLSRLIQAARTVKGEEYSTSVRRVIGKIPAILIDIVLMIYLFGIIIQFDVIIYSLIGRTYYEFFVDKDKYNEFDLFKKDIWDLYYIKFPIMFGLTILLSPVCLLKDISKMRFVSMFGICALMYSILVIVFETPWFYKHYLDKVYKKDDPITHANWFDISKGFTKDLNFFKGIATVFFVFACHPGIFPVYKSLKNNTEKRINNVIMRSVGLNLIIYLSITICGFLTSPISKEPLIIFRKKIFDNDIFMTIAKISLALDLYLSIPANYNSFRASFFMLAFKTDVIDNKRNFLVTFPVLFLATFIGAIFEDILSYIAILGGFFCSIICFFIPGALVIMTSKEKYSSPNNIIKIIILGLMCIFGFIAGVLTVKSLIFEKDVLK